MKLNIDGLNVEPRLGQSLLDLIRELGLDSAQLSRRSRYTQYVVLPSLAELA